LNTQGGAQEQWNTATTTQAVCANRLIGSTGVRCIKTCTHSLPEAATVVHSKYARPGCARPKRPPHLEELDSPQEAVHLNLCQAPKRCRNRVRRLSARTACGNARALCLGGISARVAQRPQHVAQLVAAQQQLGLKGAGRRWQRLRRLKSRPWWRPFTCGVCLFKACTPHGETASGPQIHLRTPCSPLVHWCVPPDQDALKPAGWAGAVP
jgi:hypothetical protein